MTTSSISIWRRPLTWLTMALVLLPSGLAFMNKFFQLIMVLMGDDEGAFTLVPIINYLLASLGFFMLLGWAAMEGTFRDIGKPAYDMLETEKKLEQLEENYY